MTVCLATIAPNRSLSAILPTTSGSSVMVEVIGNGKLTTDAGELVIRIVDRGIMVGCSIAVAV